LKHTALDRLQVRLNVILLYRYLFKKIIKVPPTSWLL